MKDDLDDDAIVGKFLCCFGRHVPELLRKVRASNRGRPKKAYLAYLPAMK